MVIVCMHMMGPIFLHTIDTGYGNCRLDYVEWECRPSLAFKGDLDHQ
jgi:hypothetical protein